MNPDELQHALETLDVPEIELPTYRSRLKLALLNSLRPNTPMTSFTSFRFLLPVGGIAALVLAIGGATYMAGTQTSYAAELASKSMQAIIQLSEVEQGALNMHLHAEAESILAQATQADDISVVSPEEVTGLLYPSSWMDELSADERASFEARLADEDLANAQFLQFTDDAGQKVLIAINSDNLPVYRIANVGAEDADEAAGVRALVENFGQELKFVSLLSPTAAQDIEEHYAAFVSPALLSKWQSDPTEALGRLTSSPWPQGIVVTGMEKTGTDSYAVSGTVLEVTSAEITKNAAIAHPVEITVKALDGHWKISDVSVHED